MMRSMTAYAQKEGHCTWGRIVCEIYSVNHRYLELTIRLPELFRSLETVLRDKFKKTLVRGKIECNFKVEFNQPESEALCLNENLIKQLLSALNFLKINYKMSEINPFDLLHWPGVLMAKEQNLDKISADLTPVFESCLSQFMQAREREGRELSATIEQRLANIAIEIDKINKQIPNVLIWQKERLAAKLAEAGVDSENNRFEQELILIIQKIDIAEEIDRLLTHVNEVRRIIQQHEAVGRRLDFMMQELNREANTIAAKSINTIVTNSAIEIKVLIEQMREQIQNIE